LGERAREGDLPLHIHLSETGQEVSDCVDAHGVRPVALLEEVGLLETDLVAVHGVHLNGEEWGLLGRADATVVHCPTANMKLAVGGILDLEAAREAGVRVALGT
ncbi:MAG: amidohydrolase family protein, partial [Gemmatimonadota bacterium]